MAEKLSIKGPLISNDDAWIYELLELDHTSPKMVDEFLARAGTKSVEILFNSPGGLVDVGVEIYTLLKNYKGKTTATVVYAGSAASIAMLGCEERLIAPSGQVFIHRASMLYGGNRDDHIEASSVLDKTDEAIINTYELETKLTRDQLYELMKAETFLNSDEAIKNGFCTGGLKPKTNELIPIVASSENDCIKIINKILRNDKLNRTFRSLANDKTAINDKKSINQTKKEGFKMDKAKNIDELRALYPELISQLDAEKAEAIEEAVTNENKRIADIEEIALPGFEKIISEAKKDPKMTANDVALKMCMAQRKSGVQSFNNLLEDAQEVQNIKGGISGSYGEGDNDDAELVSAKNVFKNFRR